MAGEPGVIRDSPAALTTSTYKEVNMAARYSTTLLFILLTGCASGYNPHGIPTVQDQIRNSVPNCPTGKPALCDIEGGGIVGKTYGNCRCAH